MWLQLPQAVTKQRLQIMFPIAQTAIKHSPNTIYISTEDRSQFENIIYLCHFSNKYTWIIFIILNFFHLYIFIFDKKLKNKYSLCTIHSTPCNDNILYNCSALSNIVNWHWCNTINWTKDSVCI